MVQLVKVSEIRLVQQVFNDTWFFLKDWYNLSKNPNESDYEKFVGAAGKLILKYKDTKVYDLMNDLVHAVIKHIDRMTVKENKNDEE
ncbi:hypothetical protein P261_00501 [Lachnospiraceae bacterium TWA4]|nr:hypothetical protein P261_00501 [Lachnospiraceae bacterium TWA4]